MAWEPTVLRKYNTTGHFRLLNQLRTELKGNPLVRPKEGQSIGEVNRSKSLIRAIEGRSQGYARARRAAAAAAPQPVQPQAEQTIEESASFLARLNAVELR
jgi:hypothetical protein